jgi:succinate dehydrogenase/fumarate reductase cytochrome b subunit
VHYLPSSNKSQAVTLSFNDTYLPFLAKEDYYNFYIAFCHHGLFGVQIFTKTKGRETTDHTTVETQWIIMQD